MTAGAFASEALDCLHADHDDLDRHAIRGYAVWAAGPSVVAAIYTADWPDPGPTLVGRTWRGEIPDAELELHRAASDFAHYAIKEPPGTLLERATVDHLGVHWIGPPVNLRLLPSLHPVVAPERPASRFPPLPARDGWKINTVVLDTGFDGRHSSDWTPDQPVRTTRLPITVNIAYEVYANADGTPCRLILRSPQDEVLQTWDLDRPTLQPHDPALGEHLWVGLGFTEMRAAGDYRVTVETSHDRRVLYDDRYSLMLREDTGPARALDPPDKG